MSTIKTGVRPAQLARMDKVIKERFVNEKERQTLILKINRYGSLIFEGVYGTNCKPEKLGTDTIFCMQSITKPIIATLLLILQEEGLVDVTDPVKCYLPAFDGGGKEHIHLWHFLTHTSGYDYAEIIEYMKQAQYEDTQDSKAFYKAMLEMPLPRKPHKAMSYFGFGFDILKDIIENISGESIDEYARKRLFEPLGMHDTHWIVPEEKWPRIIGRHENSWGASWLNSEESYVSQSGSAGLKSTADDMLKYCEMVINEGSYNDVHVMSRASVRAMVADHNETIQDEWEWGSWSLGWNYHGNKKDDSSILRSRGAVCHNGGGATKI
ncbi:MAG: beta-lactamase family protein, partial [Defluviitaleaceae bacterium]|nr:beta-lactamase family protein [Defluviitaleaceae bacterium]